MTDRKQVVSAVVAILLLGTGACDSEGPADTGTGKKEVALGTHEFGLTSKQLVQNIEKAEALIAKCMNANGFEYIPVDFITIKKGMGADKSLPGVSEEDFHAEYGFGVSTLYTGLPPQLNTGYSPGRVGLGEQNIQIYNNLSPIDQVSYNRTLFGENAEATFAVGLETEDFSRTGGCTREAIEQVFEPDQLKATYYNPLDAYINDDPRMKAALRKFAEEIRKKGFNYNHPDEAETDIRERLNGITGGELVPVDQMSPEQQAGLRELQDYERRVAVVTFELAEEIFDPVEESIEKELFAREVK